MRAFTLALVIGLSPRLASAQDESPPADESEPSDTESEPDGDAADSPSETSTNDATEPRAEAAPAETTEPAAGQEATSNDEGSDPAGEETATSPEIDEDAWLPGFDWDLGYSVFLNPGLAMGDYPLGRAIFSAGVAGSATFGIAMTGTDEEEGAAIGSGEPFQAFALRIGPGIRLETPNGLLVDEVMSRTYMGSLNFRLQTGYADDDFKLGFSLAAGPKVPYDADGKQLVDSQGNRIMRTVLVVGGFMTDTDEERLTLRPSFSLTWGGTDATDLPFIFSTTLAMGVGL